MELKGLLPRKSQPTSSLCSERVPLGKKIQSNYFKQHEAGATIDKDATLAPSGSCGRVEMPGAFK